MKELKNDVFALAILSFLGGITLTLLIVNINCDQNSPKSNEIEFIWNDTEESIPMDGELIKIEFTDENTVYIGPAE